MAYRVTQRIISSDDLLYPYFDDLCRKSKLLYNAALFRVRNIFTGYDKEHRTENEVEVFQEVALLQRSYPNMHVRRVISYTHLEKMMRVTENADFFSGLPRQTAQQMVKQTVTDFKNWLASLREYKKHPEKYLGKPKMPRYKKSDLTTVIITNQDAVLYRDDIGTSLKLPLQKQRLYFSNLFSDPVLKEVKIKPYYGRFLLCLTLEEPDVAFDPSGSHVCAIDLGTDNFAAIVCDDHSSAIYKGGAVLSKIQWFHKQRAKYVSIITKGHEKKHAVSKRLRDLSFHYANFVKDQCHKISRSIIDFCMEHQCGTLILGVNLLWKQRSNMNKINNQNFVSMPITLLRTMITYKALNAGIRIIEQEESYTSKADLIANDRIPTYGVDDKDASFSGKRIKRGLYRCSNGMILNADCHAAANIMRKAIPDIWKDTRDYTFLSAPDVYGFYKLNLKGIPVKGIAA
ncbi:RNA-guided endonuclease InsQ/TnpB family protein [Anaerostipes hadrus]|uniref:RNA-guided endonuclease InsQ/TnpB family protein n=1 Tax=Anaerostipes hadrus TaxID=649756 RepID=UPI0034AFC711